MAISLANLYPKHMEEFEKFDSETMIERLWDDRNFLLDLNLKDNRIMTYAALFQGSNISPVSIDL